MWMRWRLGRGIGRVVGGGGERGIGRVVGGGEERG